MTDFNMLRKSYSQFLTGGGTGGYVKRMDMLTEKHIGSVEHNVTASHEKNAPDVAEAIEGMSYSSMVNSVFKQLFEMSVSFSQSGSQYYHDTNLLALITDSLEKMSDIYNAATEPYGNWWHWEIGCPLSINNIFILIYDYADKELITRYMDAEKHFNNEIKLTGANRVWESVIFAIRGILTKDAKSVHEAVNGIKDVMVMTDCGDGFYEDGSFIQHGKFPYNGGYGRSLLQELAPIIYLVSGTEFDFDDISVIYKWIYNSYFPFLVSGRLMDMVRGREISRCYEQCDVSGAKLIGAMLIISSLPNHENKELKSRIKAQLTEDFFKYASPFAADIACALIDDTSIELYEQKPYFKAFNSMDRAVKHGKNYSIGLAMHSERIANYESINDENMNAFHTADGMLYTYKPNEPWADFFWQTINLQRLPGTTVLKDTAVKENSASSCDFVGSCGIGENGVCAMELNPVGYSLKANKAWFFFDEEIVCLGSGIKSRDDINVETVIENRLVVDDSRFTVHGSEAGGGYDIKGAYLDGRHDTGYCFPELQHVNILRELRRGGWENMNRKNDGKEHEDMYVTMWIDHGKNPRNASYEYIVIPRCDEDRLNDYCNRNDVKIIENSEWIQCVQKNNVTGIIFLKDRTRIAGGIMADCRCVVMTEEKDGGVDFVIADPTQKQKKINVELDYSAESFAGCDERIKLTQLSPYVVMEIDTDGAKGKEMRVRLEGVKNV